MRGRDEIIKFTTFISLHPFSFWNYLCKGGEYRVTFIINCFSRDSELRLPCINKIVRPPPLLSLAFNIEKFCAPIKKMLDKALYIWRCVGSSLPPRPPLRLKVEHARLDKGKSFVLPCINKIVRPPLLSLAFDIENSVLPTRKCLTQCSPQDWTLRWKQSSTSAAAAHQTRAR